MINDFMVAYPQPRFWSYHNYLKILKINSISYIFSLIVCIFVSIPKKCAYSCPQSCIGGRSKDVLFYERFTNVMKTGNLEQVDKLINQANQEQTQQEFLYFLEHYVLALTPILLFYAFGIAALFAGAFWFAKHYLYLGTGWAILGSILFAIPTCHILIFSGYGILTTLYFPHMVP